jgi:S1-C subfamily serine protease
MNPNLRAIATWTLVIVLSMSLGAAAVVGISALRDESPTTIIQQVPVASNGEPVQASMTIADLYERLRPSVVRITGTGGTGGLGSGVVIDRQGHILTNNHVIAGLNRIDVTFADGTVVAAQVVGRDPGNDLAVIKVNRPSDQLVPAVLGNSENVRVGDAVVAIGNPFDLTGTLTQGIVSGIGRTLSSGAGRPLRQLIQADAAINPGNSGGGLFNLRGELIGITTAIENPSGDRVFVGIGYAVPVNIATRFLPEMLAGATIQHPRLGVSLRDVTPSIASQFGLPVERGVMIQQVEANSGASRAGLRGTTANTPGDVIIAIDGRPVRSFDDLASYIDTKRVGDRIEVRIIREGREMTVQVTLEAWAA